MNHTPEFMPHYYPTSMYILSYFLALINSLLSLCCTSGFSPALTVLFCVFLFLSQYLFSKFLFAKMHNFDLQP